MTLVSRSAPTATILIRIMVGAVFLAEGIQKFLYPADVGAGRFARIGIPQPEWLAPFVGSTEIVCGILVLLGLFTRWAVVPLLGIMAVAFVTTKLPILLGQDLAFSAPTTFLLRLLGLRARDPHGLCDDHGRLILLLVGPGPLSIDERRTRTR